MQQPFSRTQWELIERRNNFNLLKHRTSSRLIEEYTLPFVYEEDKMSWAKRIKIRHQNVLEVLGCEIFSSLGSSDWKQSHQSMRVYMDATTQRLSQLRNVTKDQELELILPVVKGFQRLYMEYGGFKISSSLIGLTLEHEVKVWKSPNFLENKVETGIISEEDMVAQIFSLFEKLIPYHENVSTFKEAIDFVNYMKSNYIPRRKPISDLISINNKLVQNGFQFRSSYETECSKPFIKKQKNDLLNITIRDTLKMNPVSIDSNHHRKTSKNITQIVSSTTRPKLDIRAELFNSTRSLQSKLSLIEDVLMYDRQSSGLRLCILFKHSVQHDRQMLEQLQKVKGRIIDITDIRMLQKITEVVERENPNQSFGTGIKKIRQPRVSLFDVQRIKRRALEEYRTDFSSNRQRPLKTPHPPILTKEERIQQAKSMKSEVQQLLFN